MFDHPPKEHEVVSWGYAALWAGLTFVTVPFVRAGVDFANEHIGDGFFTYSVVIAVIVSVASALYLTRRRITILSGACLLGLASLVAYLAFSLAGENPVEAVHYVQYGTLSLLLFRAFSHRVHDSSIYVAATLVGTIAGIVDETIQWLTPDRVFDLKDIWLNFTATALVQVGLAVGIRPRVISGWPKWSSLRRLCYLGAMTLGSLGLCLQNTPDRVANYVEHVPWLGFVDPARNVMVEYGYLHGDPATATFRSRLTLEDLRQAASRQAEAAAPNLDQMHQLDIDGDTRIRDNSVANPYPYEARAHQLRRDQSLERAMQSNDAQRQAAHFAAAHWENVIIKEYFSNLLAGTRYVWSPEKEAMVKRSADLTQSFESAVNRHLIVTYNSRQLFYLCLIGVVLLLLGAFFCNRKVRPTKAK